MNEAARYGDLADLRRLVEEGGDVNEWEDGYQPLLRALDPNNDKMGRNQAEVVAFLINKGAALPHYYRTDVTFWPVSNDDWEIEHMCRELEDLVAKEADVALAVLLAFEG